MQLIEDTCPAGKNNTNFFYVRHDHILVDEKLYKLP